MQSGNLPGTPNIPPNMPNDTRNPREQGPDNRTEPPLRDNISAAGPRYVYYRVYTKDGAIPTKKPADQRDPYIGRIPATSVPPPHTVASLKRSLIKFETLGEGINEAHLFQSTGSPSAMEDTERVVIRNRDGLGSLAQDPLALVIQFSDSVEGSLADTEIGSDIASGESRRIYYRLYGDGLDVPSRRPINPDDPSLACFDPKLVAPPHTIDLIRCYIAKIEGNPELAFVRLYSDTSCESPMDSRHVQILSGDGPGVAIDNPMALVQAEESNPGPPRARPEGEFRFKLMMAGDGTFSDPKWLDYKAGEILYTNGNVTSVPYLTGTLHFPGFEARNAHGREGFVWLGQVDWRNTLQQG